MLKECQPARLNADMVKLFAYANLRDGMQAEHQSADLVSATNFLILMYKQRPLCTSSAGRSPSREGVAGPGPPRRWCPRPSRRHSLRRRQSSRRKRLVAHGRQWRRLAAPLRPAVQWVPGVVPCRLPLILGPEGSAHELSEEFVLIRRSATCSRPTRSSSASSRRPTRSSSGRRGCCSFRGWRPG